MAHYSVVMVIGYVTLNRFELADV